MNLNHIIYSINVEDIQEVAQQELGRDLTDAEIKKIEEPIANNIGWYDAIAFAIYEHFPEEVKEA